mmetsp:Transcript_61646/g.165094  ORF Transcript_61646/g.165094 Transcript_61646/m.165094 type:complete len:286 (+) Transcript_61646:1122-1979(+)
MGDLAQPPANAPAIFCPERSPLLAAEGGLPPAGAARPVRAGGLGGFAGSREGGGGPGAVDGGRWRRTLCGAPRGRAGQGCPRAIDPPGAAGLLSNDRPGSGRAGWEDGLGGFSVPGQGVPLGRQQKRRVRSLPHRLRRRSSPDRNQARSRPQPHADRGRQKGPGLETPLVQPVCGRAAPRGGGDCHGGPRGGAVAGAGGECGESEVVCCADRGEGFGEEHHRRPVDPRPRRHPRQPDPEIQATRGEVRAKRVGVGLGDGSVEAGTGARVLHSNRAVESENCKARY